MVEKPGERPSLPPTFSIAVEPLGFAAPGPIYLGQRSSLASLDFLDENHLLFTFRVPALLKRNSNFDEGEDSGERQVRALVLALPSGSIDADELWILHDRERYLWMLGDGHFLLRDGNEIKQGDLTLKLKPVLRFPGTLASISVDPLGKFLVTNSREPVVTQNSSGNGASSASSTSGSSSQLKTRDGPEANTKDKLSFNSGGGQAEENDTQQTPSPQSAEESHAEEAEEMVVRILERASGKVLLVSRVHSAVQLPINSSGYLESLRERGLDWSLNLYYFSGGIKRIGTVQSACLPTLEFVADDELMATVCTEMGTSRLIALTTEGKHLWELSAPSGTIWPHLVRARSGLRVARESLAVNHSISASSPFDPEDIKAQRVSVYDSVTGHVVLTATASPILDAGGNVALSASGKRIAVLHAGSIDVWDLDAPPTLNTSANQP